ncbi:MAG: MarR family winged helix-turn-helix transcriptional regulator [Methyloligellaceae bacterium]
MQDNQLIPFAELLFFAYRDFVSDPDEILNDIGFGRAHHRVLHFVNQEPGLRVADLLEILKITKQSLARVLKQLIDEEYIRQETGQADRRERHLYATDKGKELAHTLMEPQLERIKSALEGKSQDEQQLIIGFLYKMIEDQDETIASNHLNKILRQSRNNK